MGEEYRRDLERLEDWEPYLRERSGLPGPRANLELAQAAADVGDVLRHERLAASDDEFLACCVSYAPCWVTDLTRPASWRSQGGRRVPMRRRSAWPAGPSSSGRCSSTSPPAGAPGSAGSPDRPAGEIDLVQPCGACAAWAASTAGATSM
jgi:hypothetical protein